MMSRVVPGTGVKMARRLPTVRLKRVDLPTLGRPTSTTVLKWVALLSDIHPHRSAKQVRKTLDSVSPSFYDTYNYPGAPKHDQGRHRQRGLEGRRNHQGQGRGGGGRGLRRDAAVDAARRANRTARLRRVPGEAPQTRH